MSEYFGIYHICNKSIAGYTIFNSPTEYQRMQRLMQYYQHSQPKYRFSKYYELCGALFTMPEIKAADKCIEVIAYCIMPTHIHMVLMPLSERGLTSYINIILASYSKYFNIKHKRKGPLWEGRTKRVSIESHEQLLHVTRYVHLNPATAYLVEKAENWPYSSYAEYISHTSDGFTNRTYIDMDCDDYRQFTNERKNEQRALAEVKRYLVE